MNLDDFTEASRLETFISSVEKAIKKWEIADGVFPDEGHLMKLFRQGANHCRETLDCEYEFKLSFILDSGRFLFLPQENAFGETMSLHRQTGIAVLLVVNTPSCDNFTVKSALSIALSSSGCRVYCIMNNVEQNIFHGICIGKRHETRIRTSRLKFTPTNLSNLSAVCDMLKVGKNVCDGLETKLSVCWRYDIPNLSSVACDSIIDFKTDHLPCLPVNRHPEDTTMSVIAESSGLTLSSVVENDIFCNLDIRKFQKISISVQFQQELELLPLTTALQILLSGTVHEEKDPKIVTNSLPDGSGFKIQNIIQTIFGDTPSSISENSPILAVPYGSLLHTFSAHLLSHLTEIIISEELVNLTSFVCGFLSGAWLCFLQKVRRHWENRLPVPNVTLHSDRISNAGLLKWNLLHQKLIILNLCIRKIDGQADDEVFFDAMQEHHEVERDLFNQPIRHLLNGNIMIIPALFEPEILAQDEILEQQKLFENLGDSSSGAEIRRNMQTAQLLSDMQAFKAVNSDCILEDFVRWYSPRDFSDQSGLSSRMTAEGNIWRTLWDSAEPLSIADQKTLFDPVLKGEKIIHWLEILSLCHAVDHLFPIILYVAYCGIGSSKIGNEFLFSEVEKEIKRVGSNVVNAKSELHKAVETFCQLETVIGRCRRIQSIFPSFDEKTVQKLIQNDQKYLPIQQEDISTILSCQVTDDLTPKSKEYFLDRFPRKLYCIMKSDEFFLMENYSTTS